MNGSDTVETVWMPEGDEGESGDGSEAALLVTLSVILPEVVGVDVRRVEEGQALLGVVVPAGEGDDGEREDQGNQGAADHGLLQGVGCTSWTP